MFFLPEVQRLGENESLMDVVEAALMHNPLNSKQLLMNELCYMRGQVRGSINCHAVFHGQLTWRDWYLTVMEGSMGQSDFGKYIEGGHQETVCWP